MARVTTGADPGLASIRATNPHAKRRTLLLSPGQTHTHARTHGRATKGTTMAIVRSTRLKALLNRLWPLLVCSNHPFPFFAFFGQGW